MSTWRNWAGDETCTPAAIEHPRSLDELRAVVARAGSAGQRVRVAGSGHSFNDIAATDGVQVRLDHLTGLIDTDPATGLVKVHAGTNLHALNALLAERGLAFANLGDIDAQTIAGAISTATHGTGAALQNLSAQLAELELVLADGTLLRAAPDADPDVFRAARVSLGALGAIATVTLRCVPAFTLRGVDRPAPLEETLDHLEERADAAEHFEFFTFPHTGVALTRENTRTDEAPRPRGAVAAYLHDIVLNNRVFDVTCRLARRFPKRIPEINRFVTRVAGSSVRVDRSDRIFASPRLVRFTEMEYAVPREHTATAVRRILAAIDEQGFHVPFPLEVRTVAPDDAFLSPASGRATGYVAVHMYRGMAWEPYFRAVEAIMDELDGRPHWGKRHFQTAATLRPRYPEWDRFQAVRARLDPDGRFTSAHVDRVLGPVGTAASAAA